MKSFDVARVLLFLSFFFIILSTAFLGYYVSSIPLSRICNNNYSKFYLAYSSNCELNLECPVGLEQFSNSCGCGCE